jgi:hypothetical protein
MEKFEIGRRDGITSIETLRGVIGFSHSSYSFYNEGITLTFDSAGILPETNGYPSAFGIISDSGYFEVFVPLWFAMIFPAIGTAAGLVTTRGVWRFSLRTLVVAMTAVAVALELVVWVLGR